MKRAGHLFAVRALFSVALLFVASAADAQSCTGSRIRFYNNMPGDATLWFYGEWAYFNSESQRMPAAERACLSFAAESGPAVANESYPASSGYTARGYRDVWTDGSQCSFTIYGQHPDRGEQTAGMSGGNQLEGGQCLPFNGQKVPGQQCTGAGNPIDLATGNKYQAENDYRSSDGALGFSRHYNSQLEDPPVTTPFVSPLGHNWRSTYDRAVRIGQTVHPTAYVYRPDGKTFAFSASGTAFITDPDVTDRLEQRFDSSNVFIGWRYIVSANDDVEIYDANGRLLTITTRAGVVTTLDYDTAGRLSSVTDPFGKTLSFGYDVASRLSSLTIPGGQSFVYGYGASNNVNSVTQPGGTSRTYAYNEPAYTNGASLPNAMTGIFDESGTRYATFRYNSSMQVLSTEHAGGVDKYEIQSLATPSGGLTTFLDPLGRSRTLTLSIVQGVPRVNGASARSNLACARYQSSERDVNGNITSAVDFNGVQTNYAVDTVRNLEVWRMDAANTPQARPFSTQWHPTFRIPVQIYGAGQDITYTHDANGNVLTKTVQDVYTFESRTWTYTYNSYGKVLTADGPRADVSDIITYTYYNCTTGNQCGQVHTITNAAGHVTTYNTYNAHGQPLTITDANGVLTTLTYDLRQRLTSRTVGAEATTFEYWPTGLLKKATLPDASYLLYTYDAAHRLTGIADSEGNRVVYTLDNMGNRIEEDLLDPSDVLTQTRSRVFDTLNRLQKEIGAAGTANVTTTFGYDDNDNQTSIAAPLGRDSALAYDGLNRLAQLTDPLSGTTHYEYDALDQLVSVTDPKGLVTSYVHNRFGDLVQQISPDTGMTVNTYDGGGNLATSTDARNAITTHTYDTLNRVASTSFAVGSATDQTLTYAYDAGTYGKGRLTGVSDSAHSLSWTYDNQGRLLTAGQTVGSVSKTTGYAYANGKRQSMTTPSGQVITYGYANGKITSISVNGTVLVTDVLYDPFGPVRQWEWGSGALSVRTFDQDGNVTQIDSGGLKTYAYDDAFRITGITDTTSSALSWTYGYDDLDRLTSASKTGTMLGYAYDANGNRLAQTGTSASAFTVAANSNRLDSTSGALTRTYEYDEAGNTIGFDGISFAYNNRGRMKSSTKSGVTTNYIYNALGQLIKKGTSTLYYYDDAGHVLGVYNNGGTLIEEIVWLGDIPLATLRPRSGGGIDIYYIHNDHLNTPRLITASVGSVVRWRWDAEPFGGGTVNNNPTGAGVFEFNLRFPGQIYFAETGLHYNYFRDGYDAATGRYTQSDPIGLGGGLNTYLYVDANPVLAADSSGLVPGPNTRKINCNQEDSLKCQAECHSKGEEYRGCKYVEVWRIKSITNGERWTPIEFDWKRIELECRCLDKTAAKCMAAAAIMIYYIVSEGSRIVFPPRNFVPVL